MPAFWAAFGSFHAKSSVMYFVRILTTVRILPLILTFSLIRSSALTVSTFGVRSYSDQRYWSIQTSELRHPSIAADLTPIPADFCPGSVGPPATNSTGDAASRDNGRRSAKAAVHPISPVSTEPTASLPSFRSGSGVLNVSIRTGCVAGRGIGGWSDKSALPFALSATEPPSSPSTIAWDASTCSTLAVADVARLTSIRAPVPPGEKSPASAAASQPARATVPHNAIATASRRELFTPASIARLHVNHAAKAGSKWSREEEKL